PSPQLIPPTAPLFPYTTLFRSRRLAEDVRREGFTRALLLGMGGSSLAPEVLKETFGRIDGFPEVLVLDSTDPAQIKALERKVDLDRKSTRLNSSHVSISYAVFC